MRQGAWVILVLSALPGGCKPFESWLGRGGGAMSRPAAPGAAVLPKDDFRLEPLIVQQAKLYPETAGGRFVSLADFEDVPDGPRGFEQIAHFAVRPEGPGAQRKFVVNITRTGVGALEAALPAGAELEFALPHFHDFTGYTLLLLAVHSRTVRDDLRVTLVSRTGRWRSQRKLLRPGWNHVMVDIRRLTEESGFDVPRVEALRIGLPDAAGGVWLGLDDVLLIDNQRTIEPAPAGVQLRKSGLDYTLSLPGQGEEVSLTQQSDGLWRFGRLGAQVRLAGVGEDLPAEGERLELMGARRIGQVELLEHNRIRLRLANTWYFPKRAGEWASLAVRTIRWEHTVYGDGRWIVQGTLNNAGGTEISSVGVYLPVEAAWAGGILSDHHILREFSGEVGRWRYLLPPSGPAAKTITRNYLEPGRLAPTIAGQGAFAPGDAARDGFDESQGCYFLAAEAGHCRFTLLPPPEGLWNPVFLISGRWVGPTYVGSEGLAVRTVVRQPDGSILFLLPGAIRRPAAVEVTGKAPLLPAR